MRKLTMLLAAAWAIITLAAPSMAAGQPLAAGVVIYVKGPVTITHLGSTSPAKLKLNDNVYEGDVIATAESGQTSIAFTEGAEVRLNEKSQFTVSQKSQSVSERISLAFGELWTRLLTHEDNGGFGIRTNTAVASVRGTEADVDFHGEMVLKVYEGHVDLVNSAGKQSLTAGQISRVSGAGSAPSEARKMTSKEFGTWQNNIKVKNIQGIIKKLQAMNGAKRRTLKIRDNKTGKEIELQLERRDSKDK